VDVMMLLLLSQPSEFNANIEWSSVFQTARPYDPYLIPIPICMGRQDKGELPPPALNNAELLKVCFMFIRYVCMHLLEMVVMLQINLILKSFPCQFQHVTLLVSFKLYLISLLWLTSHDNHP